MKILHCADLHLGRSFHERSLIEDQRAALEYIAKRLADGPYAALIIAGDIYDRSVPSPEAVTLLSSFLQTLKKRCPSTALFLSPGNHDSAERLSYAAALLADLDIHIVTDAEKAFTPVTIEYGEERCAVFQLPFLTPGCLSAEDAEGRKIYPRSQRELLALASDRLETARQSAVNNGATSTLLAAHLFATGGEESDSERVFLGTAERVDLSQLSSFDYIALGHLHRAQKVTERAWYSGSLLAYSFDEADITKVCLSVELLPNKPPRIEKLELPALHPVKRLRGSFAAFSGAGGTEEFLAACDACGDAYLELILDDKELVDNPLAILRHRFPYLLSVKQDAAFSGRLDGFGPSDIARENLRRGAKDDFVDFLMDLYGRADPAKTTLFDLLAAEADSETA